MQLDHFNAFWRKKIAKFGKSYGVLMQLLLHLVIEKIQCKHTLRTVKKNAKRLFTIIKLLLIVKTIVETIFESKPISDWVSESKVNATQITVKARINAGLE